MGCLRVLLSLLVALAAVVVGTLLWAHSLPDVPVDTTLSPALQEWEAQGQYVSVYNRSMFVMDLGARHADSPAFLFVHGYPSSSFDYRACVHEFASRGRVVIVDHIGFGFSDKPDEFSYSIHEYADYLLECWRLLGVKHGHIIAHDLGDSILTEVLARRDMQQLPSYFDNFFSSVTFTNGGMKVDLINFRISQRALLVPFLGKALNKLVHRFDTKGVLFDKQVASVWGDQNKVQWEEISLMKELNLYKGGAQRMYLLQRYLHDRYRFESRWAIAWRRLDLPCHLLWGDSDAVSPLAIPRAVQAESRCRLRTLAGVGHFLMLEAPAVYAQAVLAPLAPS